MCRYFEIKVLHCILYTWPEMIDQNGGKCQFFVENEIIFLVSLTTHLVYIQDQQGHKKVYQSAKNLAFHYFIKWVISISGQENTLADRINDGLSSKYYWRDWLVVVYPEMTGSDVHWRHHCGEKTGVTVNYIHWEKRYNILVSSIPSTTSSRTFTGTVKGYHSERYRVRGSRGRYEWRTRYTHYNAKQMYENLPRNARTCTYPLVGCVIQKGTFAVRAPANRKYYKVVSNLRKICTARGCRKYYYQKFNVFILG